MSEAINKILSKFDDETAGVMKEAFEEFARTSEKDFEERMEKSQEEVAKMKETFKGMGIDFNTLTTDQAKVIKEAITSGGKRDEGTREERLKALGGVLSAFAGAKGNLEIAKQSVDVWVNKAVTAEEKDFAKSIQKAVNTTTFEGGGAVIQTVYSNDFIGALRDQEFMSKLRLRRVNFVGGQYIIGKHNAGVTAAYVGETKKVNKDQPKFGNVVLTPKKAGVIVPISREWLTNADMGAFENVTRDALNAMEELRGYTFLEGTGTEHTPKGLATMVNDANVQASAGPSVANIVTDLLYGRKKLSSSKINIRAGAYILNPNQVTHLWGLRDTTAEGFVFRDEMMTGKLFGYEYHETTAAASKVYFADFDKIYEASNRNLEMQQANQASYVDSNGNQVNLFEQDMEAMRLIHAHDFGTQYDKAIAIVKTVAWGN